nr:hypothetical protein [uncultured Dongia sp.]
MKPNELRPRAQLEAAIQAAIEALDLIDGDPDLQEDNEDMCEAYEDDLGKTFPILGAGDETDAEPNGDDEPEAPEHESDSDDEPDFARDYRSRTLGSLGHPECFQPYTSAAQLVPEFDSSKIGGPPERKP